MQYRKLFVIILLLFSFRSQALIIKGHIELEEGWQPVVFLASLNSPDDLFVASPDFILTRTFVKPDGTYFIQTDDVPNEPMFYRIYLVRGDNTSVEFSTSRYKNYQHLLLTLNSSIELNLSIEDNALVVNDLKGSEDCAKILDFDREFEQKSGLLMGEVSKARSNFISHELVTFIRDFVNSGTNSILGLYALWYIDSKDTDFLSNSDFYFKFQKRLKETYPNHPYTKRYDTMLDELVGFRDFVCEMPGVQPKWKDHLLVAQSVVLVLCLFVIAWLLLRNRKHSQQILSSDGREAYENLTLKQQEILKLLANGKTNKEIAQELFVELSTVKTHINNIYRQLNVDSRKQAADFYKSISI
ncbi:MAG: LuxR C-terminal-related transcriptional regulator [Draconibacterium sp.]